MKRSTERILTTHVGSLARSDSLTPLLRLREQAQPYDREELERQVRESVRHVVQKQIEAGVADRAEAPLNTGAPLPQLWFSLMEERWPIKGQETTTD